MIRRPPDGIHRSGRRNPEELHQPGERAGRLLSRSGAGGHRYALQIITDAPHFGGASGSTLDEAQSWGKLSVDADQVTVHADATLAFPLLSSALAASGRDLLAARRPASFALGGRALVVDGAPVPVDRFDGLDDQAE